MRDKYCKFCGSPHVESTNPQRCVGCQSLTWYNPTPVAVMLQPVVANGRTGILIGERGIQPQKGNWNLIGGFVDPEDHTIEHAAVRELMEETGVHADVKNIRMMRSFSDTRCALVFCWNSGSIPESDLDLFEPNHECPAVRVAWEPEELCFHSHTDALADWFAKNPH